jgi:hypothetical protein
LLKEDPMPGPIATPPRAPRPIPGATLSLISLGLSELGRDLRLLLASRWDETVRRRAEELSAALADTCEGQGLATLVRLLRVASHLTRIPRAQALPLQAALKAKIESLLREMPLALPRRPIRIPG